MVVVVTQALTGYALFGSSEALYCLWHCSSSCEAYCRQSDSSLPLDGALLWKHLAGCHKTSRQFILTQIVTSCRLGTQRSQKGYWSSFATLEQELKSFAGSGSASGGAADCMPSQQELKKAGRLDLLNAIANWGGMQAVAARLRLCHR